jgi:hypothetical protein
MNGKTLRLVGEELPDATITREDREHLKWVLETISAPLSYQKCMYLSCGFEHIARQKKNGEEVAL